MGREEFFMLNFIFILIKFILFIISLYCNGKGYFIFYLFYCFSIFDVISIVLLCVCG